MRTGVGRGRVAVTVGALAVFTACRPTFPYHDPTPVAEGAQDGHTRPANPYAEVDWERVQVVHSVSHHHGERSAFARMEAAAMGIQHLPFSDYYPSAPAPRLDDAIARAFPDAIHGLNAEQHSVTNHGLHFNALGSHYTTGGMDGIPGDWSSGVADHTFQGLRPLVIDDRPWESVYMLHLLFEPGAPGDTAAMTVTIDGARRCDGLTFQPIGDGRVTGVRLSRPEPYLLCPERSEVRVQLAWDPNTTAMDGALLLQGVHRSWQDAFDAALDGDRVDDAGLPIEGLRWEDAGGITLNHPTSRNLAGYQAMLDFDRRVLGIEVWNQHFLFGGSENPDPATGGLHFYDLWDSLLRSGRQVFGFFVKDHALYGRGRNVLLVPPLEGLSEEEREWEAMRAYREGRFFGSLGASHVDAQGAVVPPYDHSDFRFTRLALVPDPESNGLVLDVEVGGHNAALRPNLQLRAVTDCSGTRIVDGESAARIPVVAEGDSACTYVRVEAFAYPNTHLLGQRLTAGRVANLSVLEIARLHDRRGDLTDTPLDAPGDAPIPIVELIFSQAIRLDEIPE